MRKLLWLMLLLAVSGSLVACGRIETKIEYISYLRNTDDTKGPYAVQVVINSDFQPLKANLVYSTDDWKTRQTVSMTQNDDSMFKGYIPGQTAGTTIRYFVEVEDSDGRVVTDPQLSTATPPSNEATGYRFQIQSTP